MSPNALNQETLRIRNSLPTRALTANKLAFSLSQQSDSTRPNAWNQKTVRICNSSPTRAWTANKFAFSLSQQSNSTRLKALNKKTFHIRNSSLSRDLKTTLHDPLDRKEPNPVQGNNDHIPPTENILSNLAPIPSHDTRSSSHTTRNASPTRDLTTTAFASSALQQSDSTPPDVLNQPTFYHPLDQKKEETSQGDMPS
jgi:hypothetical protein